MSGFAPVVLAAAAGGLVAVGAREAIAASPALAAWTLAALDPLRRAGSEGYSPTETERRRLGLLGSSGLLAIIVLLGGFGPLAVLAAAGPTIAGSAVAQRRARYRRSVEKRMPVIATAVADALGAGRSVRGALVSAASSLEGPAAAEMARLSADLSLGVPTAVALRELRERLDSEPVEVFCAALISQQLAGGDLALLLRRYASATADRQRAGEDARAATAQARFTGLLVVAMPAGAALFAELLAPGFVARVLAAPAAVAMVLGATVLQGLGFAAINRLGRVEE